MSWDAIRTSFDRYVVADWSARSSPATGSDTIWIGELVGDGEVRLANPNTRQAAFDHLVDLVGGCGDERVLLCFDVSLGYPAGTAQLLGLPGTPWEATWGLIAELSQDDDQNRNNRFDVAAVLNRRIGGRHGPFWGCPASHGGDWLRPKKPPSFPVEQFRLVERRLKSSGRHPASCWQLLGAGSVGSQTLTLLARLVSFRAASSGQVDIWPFTTGLRAPVVQPGGIVIAEVWPTLFYGDHTGAMVKDAAQVQATAARLSDADRRGELRSWFEPPVDEPERAVVVDEEGWVLGVGRGAHLR